WQALLCACRRGLGRVGRRAGKSWPARRSVGTELFMAFRLVVYDFTIPSVRCEGWYTFVSVEVVPHIPSKMDEWGANLSLGRSSFVLLFTRRVSPYQWIRPKP